MLSRGPQARALGSAPPKTGEMVPPGTRTFTWPRSGSVAIAGGAGLDGRAAGGDQGEPGSRHALVHPVAGCRVSGGVDNSISGGLHGGAGHGPAIACTPIRAVDSTPGKQRRRPGGGGASASVSSRPASGRDRLTVDEPDSAKTSHTGKSRNSTTASRRAARVRARPPGGLGAGAGAERVDGGHAHQQALGVEAGDAEAADDLGRDSAGQEHVGRASRRHRAGGDLAVVCVDEHDVGVGGQVVVAIDAVARGGVGHSLQPGTHRRRRPAGAVHPVAAQSGDPGGPVGGGLRRLLGPGVSEHLGEDDHGHQHIIATPTAVPEPRALRRREPLRAAAARSERRRAGCGVAEGRGGDVVEGATSPGAEFHPPRRPAR